MKITKSLQVEEHQNQILEEHHCKVEQQINRSFRLDMEILEERGEF